VLCIGDSVTAGVVAGGGVPYVSHLRRRLGSRYEVINAGGSGTSALDWMRPPAPPLPAPFAGAYEILAEEHMPAEIVVVELGGNDAVGFWEPRPTPPERYRDTMMQLVIRLRGDGARRVLLVTTFPNPGASPEVEARLMRYRLSLLCVRWRGRARVVDVWRLLDLETDFEGLNPHPNERGHWKLAHAVERAIRHDGKPRWRCA
jgi:hypothetical protein